MKKDYIINRIRKADPQSTSRLQVGHIVAYNHAEHLVWQVNDSRAALIPLSNLGADSDNISPESEIPILRKLTVEQVLELWDKPAKARGTKQPSNDEPKLGKLGGYLGHTVVSVIQTLGKAGWTFAETRAAFDRVGIAAADQTLRIQLKAGRDGNGSMADLSAKDIAHLKGKPAKATAARKPKAPKAPAPAVESVAANSTEPLAA